MKKYGRAKALPYFYDFTVKRYCRESKESSVNYQDTEILRNACVLSRENSVDKSVLICYN